MFEWVQGFVVGASLAAAPMAFAVGVGKGQKAAMEGVKALPVAIGEAVGNIKKAMTEKSHAHQQKHGGQGAAVPAGGHSVAAGGGGDMAHGEAQGQA